MNNLPLARSGRTAFEIATEAAKEAGIVILEHFYSKKDITRKGKSNLVTEVDTSTEKLIIDRLKNEYPDYSILSEESNSSTSVHAYTWVVDPLDGTNNYVFGIPFFCTNIALVNNEDILLGITYDPVRDELFHSERGQGAYLNGSSIHVSNVSLLEDSLVGVDLGYNVEEGEKILDVIKKLWSQVHCLRLMGSAALSLAYVACGRISLYLHRYLYPWDIASGLLLVREANGEVVDWSWKPAGLQTEKIIASNGRLSRNLIGYLD